MYSGKIAVPSVLFFVLFTLTSVVPQGTNLGPLLFYLVFIYLDKSLIFVVLSTAISHCLKKFIHQLHWWPWLLQLCAMISLRTG
jgi:hypothetical protein